MYNIVYSSQAQKDAKKANNSGLRNNIQKIIEILQNNPYQNPPPFEKLLGDLSGVYSRRINIRHRLVYQVYEKEKIVKIIRMWTHYE
ncbi:MAG: Txe/YoeB family addiction module toxin [Spirochaetes bacterium]|nr:Txe/YoeB family addiction module toxin [Spirochaetota bacterium]